MDLEKVLGGSTFGVEFEMCACLFDLLQKCEAIKGLIESADGEEDIDVPEHLLESIPEMVRPACENGYTISRYEMLEVYWSILNSCGEEFRASELVENYSTWGIANDGSIKCGFKELAEEWENDESDIEMAEMLLQNELGERRPDRGYTAAKTKEAEQLREQVRIMKNRVGLIIPEDADPASMNKDKLMCTGTGDEDEEDLSSYMLAVELVSKKYHLSEMPEFRRVVDECIYNDRVVYQHNTSQGLHISIGNDLLEEIGQEATMEWLTRFVQLWYKYEIQLLSYVPEHRGSVAPGSKRDNDFAVPLHNVTKDTADGPVRLFSSRKRLIDASSDTLYQPGWVTYFARDELGNNAYGGRPKYTAINVKGLSSNVQDGRLSVTTAGAFVEFRMLPVTANISLIEAWVTLLSCMSAICMVKATWVKAMKGDRLGDMFPDELSEMGQQSIRTIKDSRGTEVMYSYSQHEEYK